MTKYKQMAEAYKAQSPTCDYSPLHVYIEPTNRCNLSCSHCPNFAGMSQGGFMRRELYMFLMQQLEIMGVEWVYLFHLGEPMLHPRIQDMITYANSRGLKVRLHTNGTHDVSHLTYVDRLCISVNETLLADTYRTIQVLIEAGKQFEFYDYRENKHNWRCAAGMSEEPRKHRCSQPYKAFVITWDGRCSVCCADSDGLAMIGDAGSESLQSIWNGIEMQAHRMKPQKWCNHCTMKDSVND